jgi:anti-sigma-K factor RskA
MTPFEEELKQAMQRQEPAADFTARVLERCAKEDAKQRAGFWQMFGVWRLSVAVAALLCTMAGGTIWERHQHEVKGLAAKRQLVLAMRIAGTKLREVQEQVNESEKVEQQ